MKKMTYLLPISCICAFLTSCINVYDDCMQYYNENDYTAALECFKSIDENDKAYEQAQEMIGNIENIFTEKRLEQERQDSIRSAQQERQDSLKKAQMEEIERIRQDSIARTKIIGRWVFSLTPTLLQDTWIYSFDGEYKLKRQIIEKGREDDASPPRIRDLIFSIFEGKKRFDDPQSGSLKEYYIIEDDGTLSVYDIDGFIRKSI